MMLKNIVQYPPPLNSCFKSKTSEFNIIIFFSKKQMDVIVQNTTFKLEEDDEITYFDCD